VPTGLWTWCATHLRKRNTLSTFADNQSPATLEGIGTTPSRYNPSKTDIVIKDDTNLKPTQLTFSFAPQNKQLSRIAEIHTFQHNQKIYIMFTPARYFLLETPWRIIIPNPSVNSHYL
jgi:hypothetical protein